MGDRLREAANFLATPAATKARPYLQEPLQLALDLVELLTDEWQTSQQIANRLDKQINRETVTQVLQCLSKAFAIESQRGKGWRFKQVRR